MKNTMIIGAILATLTFSTIAEGKEGNYFGFGATQFNIEDPSFEADVMTLDGRLGMHFNEIFSGEIRAGFGINDDTVNFDLNSQIIYEMKNYYGAYFRVGVPAVDSFYPYVIVGHTRGKVKMELVGSPANATESMSDVSYGLGSDFALSDDFDLTVEYMKYLDKDGVEVDGVSLGFKASF